MRNTIGLALVAISLIGCHDNSQAVSRAREQREAMLERLAGKKIVRVRHDNGYHLDIYIEDGSEIHVTGYKGITAKFSEPEAPSAIKFR